MTRRAAYHAEARRITRQQKREQDGDEDADSRMIVARAQAKTKKVKKRDNKSAGGDPAAMEH